MKKIIIAMIFCLSCLSCATVMTGGIQSVPVITDPQGAKVAIIAPDKSILFEGYTPCNIILTKDDLIGSTLIISKDGFKRVDIKIERTIDFCFWGNACIGGFPAIIDIITGSWKRANIGPVLVKLDELQTVMLENDMNSITVASQNDKQKAYHCSFTETKNAISISVTEL